MFIGETDLALTVDGDLDIEQGSLKLVDGLDWLYQMVLTIMRTETGDWKTFPNLGGSLSRYVGETNTRETAKRIENDLTLALSRQPWPYPGKVGVRAVPTGIETLSLFVFVDLPDNTRTYLQAADFSYNSGGVSMRPITLDTPEEYPSTIGTHEVTENEYLQRIAQQRMGERYF